jgi:phage protein D
MLGEILQTIAGRNDMQAMIAPALAGIRIAHEDQADESDMAFLVRLARRHDAIACVKFSQLLLMPQAAGESATGEPIPPVTLTRSVGDQHRFSQADRDSFTGARAWWYDTAAAKRRDVLAGDDERAENVRGDFASEAEAWAAANAAWKVSQRAGATLSLNLAEGRPDLIPETPVTLQGFKAEIDEIPWIITQVTHNLTDSGYTGSIELEVRPAD